MSWGSSEDRYARAAYWWWKRREKKAARHPLYAPWGHAIGCQRDPPRECAACVVSAARVRRGRAWDALVVRADAHRVGGYPQGYEYMLAVEWGHTPDSLRAVVLSHLRERVVLP